jgi:hypothetical protein
MSKIIAGLRITKYGARAVKNGMTIRDGIKNLFDNLDSMKSPKLLVGIPGDEDGRAGEPIGNAELGYTFEYGSAALNRPATPWLVPGAEAAIPRMVEVLKTGAEKGNRQAVEIALNKAGLIAVSTIKNRIVDQVGLPTPDSPVGKKYMIDTAQLLNSINFVLE